MGHNTTTNDTDIRLISISEACKRLGISHWSIYQQINNKALKTVKLGGRRLVREQTLSEFVKAMEQ